MSKQFPTVLHVTIGGEVGRYYLCRRLASKGIVTLGATLSRVCLCVRRAALVSAAKVMGYIHCCLVLFCCRVSAHFESSTFGSLTGDVRIGAYRIAGKRLNLISNPRETSVF